MTTFFQLHPRLQQDCLEVGRFGLCRLLLMNDSQYPWLILVPEVPGIQEVYQLDKSQRLILSEESCYLSEQLATLYRADKMNVAAIGNVVPQLHVHHVVRYRYDKAWPEPVWGHSPTIPYSPGRLKETIALLVDNLALNED